MMNRRISVVLIFIISLFCVGINAEGLSRLNLTEPISKTVITIPEGEVVDSALNKFEKFKVYTPSSVLSIFSMENPENEPFSWKRINEFDKNKKYGSLISKERLDGNTDGWVRYYSTKNDSGQDLINCVSLVRGNGYALYILETAYDKAGLVSPAIIKATEFKPITDHRVNNDGEFTWRMWAVLAGIIVFALLLKFVQKGLSDAFLIILSVIVLGGLFCGMYFYAKFSFSISTTTTGIVAGLWIFILLTSSWKEAGKSLENILSNMGD